MEERLQKILSQWGFASRRQAENMILQGRVRLNGNIAQLGDKADLSKDILEVDGVTLKISKRPKLIYLLINKPLGVVSTCYDPQKRPTVLDLLPPPIRSNQGVHPVGRLDVNSTGALILTNDGDLTLSLTHPRYHLPKTYHVLLNGHPTESILNQWRNGVDLMGKKTLPAIVKVLKHFQKQTLLEIVLTEGRNRQIRRVASSLGFEVVKLHRSAIGIIQLDVSPDSILPQGQYRFLKDFEIDFLVSFKRTTTSPFLK